MINTLDKLKTLTTDMDHSGAPYNVLLYNLLPLVQYTRQFTHQKDLAEYLSIHPAKLSSFITMTRGLEPSNELSTHIDIDIDIEALKKEVEGLFNDRLH